MDRLFIGDAEIDLSPDTVIALTMQINDIADLSDRQAGFSNTFQIPDTANNRKALGFSDTIQSSSVTPYNVLGAKVIKEGIETVSSGSAIIESFDGNFNITIYYGIYDFFQALKYQVSDVIKGYQVQGDKMLSDLDLSAFDHTFDMATIIGMNGRTDVMYPIINYNNVPNLINNQVDVRYLRPAISWYTLLNEIIMQAGFTFKISNTFKAYLTKIIFPFCGNEITYDADTITANLFRVTRTTDSAAVSSSGTSGFASLLNLPKLYIICDDDSTSPHGTLDFDNSSLYDTTTGTFTVTFAGTYNFKGNVKVFNQFTSTPAGALSASGVLFSILIIEKNGVAIASQIFANSQIGIGNETSIASFDFSNWASQLFLKVGDKIKIYINSSLINTQFYGSSGEITSADYTYSGSILNDATNDTNVVYNELSNIVTFGAMIKMSNVMPDMTQSDFIKYLAQTTGMIFDHDPVTNQIILTQFQDIINNIPNAKDWSAKLNNAKDDKIEYRVGSYGQNNEMNYTPDQTNLALLGLDNLGNLSLGDGYFQIGDTTLPGDIVAIQLPFAGTIMNKNLLMGIQLPQIYKCNGVPDFTVSAIQRVLILDTQTLGATIDYVDGVGSNPQKVNIPLCYFTKVGAPGLSFSDSLIQDNYSGLIATLQNCKKVTPKFYLNAVDIYRFDHMIPVFVSKYGAYFYVNKITNYTNAQALTAVELIRL